jgi:uncharacterized protein YbbK (DUF523 family)
MLISGCLAGLPVRFDGRSKPLNNLAELAKSWVLVPICPEILGGLGIPRPRCHFSGGDGQAVLDGIATILDEIGRNRTDQFLNGARIALQMFKLVGPDLILFKEGSPSCGLRRVDVDGAKHPGMGVTAAVLKPFGVPIITEEDPLP